MQEFKCKKCNQPLNWEDTYRTSGSIVEGYRTERQLWSCEHCQIDYTIEQIIEFNPNLAKVIDFQEA